MQHVMVDIETLSTEANAVILAIGAVWFDPHGEQFRVVPGTEDFDKLVNNPEYGGTLPYDLFPLCFERKVDIETNLTAGRAVSGSTLRWWAEQGDDARLSAFNGETGLREALNDLHDFTMMVKAVWPKHAADSAEGVAPVNLDDVSVWGNGASFDNSVLGNAYHNLGYETPWSFRHNRCYRTHMALAGEKLGDSMPELVRVGTFHNALDDAVTQALHMQRVNAALREREVGLAMKAAA